MKSTGIIREMDELGRIVIPKELRRTLSMEKGSHIEIFTDKDMICLKKAGNGCVFCGKESEHLTIYMGKYVCADCAKNLSSGK